MLQETIFCYQVVRVVEGTLKTLAKTFTVNVLYECKEQKWLTQFIMSSTGDGGGGEYEWKNQENNQNDEWWNEKCFLVWNLNVFAIIMFS